LAVRRLVFGEESRFGAYIGVLTLPDAYGTDGEIRMHVGVGRTAGMYGAPRPASTARGRHMPLEELPRR
jgi:hypothetical protein